LCQGSGTRFYQGSKNTSTDQEGFIAQFNLNNMGLTWSTLFGGQGTDAISSVHVANGKIYVGGYTQCSTVAGTYSSPIISHTVSNFPLANPGSGAFFQTTTNGDDNFDYNFFVGRFNSNYQLEWSTFFGASSGTIPSMASNSSNDLFIVGEGVDYLKAAIPGTTGNAFGKVPVYHAASPANIYYETPAFATQKLLAAKFDVNCNLKWSTFIQGSVSGSVGAETYNAAIAVDANDKIYIGTHNGVLTPTIVNVSGLYNQDQNASASMSGDASRIDNYILALNSDLKAVWATFMGGAVASSDNISSLDRITDLAIGGDKLFITGETKCTTSPYHECPTGAYCDITYDKGTDNFISRFSLSSIPDEPTLSVNETTNDIIGIKVYPNPTDGLIHVSLFNRGKESETEVNLYDQLGRVLSKSSIRLHTGINQFSISMSGFAQGMYNLEIKNDESRSTAKVVKY
jgi:hypothetical protein